MNNNRSIEEQDELLEIFIMIENGYRVGALKKYLDYKRRYHNSEIGSRISDYMMEMMNLYCSEIKKQSKK